VYVADVEASERMGLASHLDDDPGFAVRYGDELSATAATVEAEIGDAEIVCVALGQVTEQAIENASDLRLIVKCGIGVDNIDAAAAGRRGIPVLRVGGVNFRGVAEYVIGAMIALNRQLIQFDAAVRRGEWASTRERWTGRVPALTDKVLGIIGVGSIGAEIARLAAAHGMELLGSDPYLDVAVAAELGVALVEKEELLERADVVSLSLLLDDTTEGFISDPELDLMQPSALLVNASRGPIVDEAALVRALGSGAIAGAALDVFEHEPLSTRSPLVGLENCLLSPHLAGCTDYGYAEIGTAAVGLVKSFRDERPVPPGSVVLAGGELIVGTS
jgi:phosphoglycerate dehydrogenase-like enzyme